jgi:peptidyl-prolyl isomerase E (cyclophilin E)
LKQDGFVEYMDADDAQDAIDNMHMCEIHGRTLKVNLARERSQKPTENTNRPIWADDFFYRKKLQDEGMDEAEGLENQS